MNKFIKLLILSLIAVFGLFIGAQNVSAQNAVTTCNNAVWSATLYGTVTPNGTTTQAWFEWGVNTSLGYTTPKQSFNNNSNYSQLLKPLAENKTYYYRAMAQNQYGTATGSIKTFSTGVCSTPPPPTPAPTVSISANPTSVSYNGSSVITWSSTDATSCTATGGVGNWAGNKNTSGNFHAANLTNSTTFNISCSNSTDSKSAYTTVSVSAQPTPAPTVTLTANPSSVSYGGSSTLSWSSTNATSCTASGGNSSWPGSKNISGSFYTGALTSSTTFYISCSGAGGSASAPAVVNVGSQPVNTTGTISAGSCTIPQGNSSCTVPVIWNTTNPKGTSAVTANGMTSVHANSGNQKMTVPYSSRLFYLYNSGNILAQATGYASCASNTSWNGSVCASTYTPPVTPNPTVNLTVNPSTISSGSSSVISWTSTDATSCIGNGFNTGNNTSSSISTGPLYSSQNYSITCTNSSGNSAYDNASVTVTSNPTPQTPLPTVNLTADSLSVNYGSGTYIRWTSSNATSCNATNGSGSWFGSKNLNGYFLTGGLTSSTNYTITCTNSGGGTSSDTVYITVNNIQNNQLPSVTTYAPSSTGGNYATLNGYVTSNGGSSTRAWFEWGTNTYYGNQTSQVNYGSGSNYSYYLSGLSSNTTYYYRAVAQNDNGQIVYGNQRTFFTTSNFTPIDNNRPLVTTYQASNINTNGATLNGYVDPNNTNATRWFEWSNNYGSLVSSTTRRTQGYSRGNFNETISNLSPNTIYYFRAVAQGNNGQIAYGNVLTFTTNNTVFVDTCANNSCFPTAITSIATNVGTSSARLNGLGLANDSVSNTGFFQYGLTQSLGRETEREYIGAGRSNPFNASLFSLASSTTFYYRAVVTNQYGTAYGDILSFRTNARAVTTNTKTNTNTTTTNNTNTSNTSNTTTTVVTNTQLIGAVKPSLVFLSVSRNNETIRIGDSPEYVIYYKNVSSENLHNIVLQVHIPKELTFVESSRGYYSEENGTVVVNIGSLNSGQEGSVFVRTSVNKDADINKVIVVTANLVYTIVSSNTQEEVLAYSVNTIAQGNSSTRVELGALALLFGTGFLPNTLLGWMIIILLIALVVLAIRRFYDKPSVILTRDSSTNAHQ